MLKDLEHKVYFFVSESKFEYGSAFSHCQKYDAQKIFGLYPVLKNKFSQEKIDLTPGYHNGSNDFMPFPIILYRVQIDPISITVLSDCSLGIKTCLTIVSENNSIQTKFQIDTARKNFSSVFSYLNSTIRFLNQCVYEGREMSRLETLNPLKYEHISTDVIHLIKSYVNGLIFEYYESGQSRPGKDDVFSTEIEITPVNKVNYLEEILIHALSDLQIRSRYVGNKLIGELESDTAWRAFKTRQKITKDNSFTIGLKEDLKMTMYKVFSWEDYFFELNTT